jgi:hypothetical protein
MERSGGKLQAFVFQDRIDQRHRPRSLQQRTESVMRNFAFCAEAAIPITPRNTHMNVRNMEVDQRYE